MKVYEGENFGGICSVFVSVGCDLPDVGFRKDRINHQIRTGQKVWEEMDCLINSASWNSVPKRGDHGIFYDQKIQLTIRYLQTEVSEYLNAASERNCAVLLQTANGVQLLIGCKREPLKLDFSSKTGEKGPDTAGYELAITGQTLVPFAFYTSTESPGDFDTADFAENDFYV